MHDKKKARPCTPTRLPKFSHSLDKNTHRSTSASRRRTARPSIGLLQTVTANLSVIYVKTRNYHWNITGPRFHTLHLFFEAQYKELGEAADEVAERIADAGRVFHRHAGRIL